jgi:hypothetical protein
MEQMPPLNDETRAEIRAVAAGLCAEMRAIGERLGTRMRVLHEEVIERIARLDDGQGRRAKRRKRR